MIRLTLQRWRRAWLLAAWLALPFGAAVASAEWLPDAGEWAPVSLNTIGALDPCPGRKCSYSGNLGIRGLIDAWNGGVLAPNLGDKGSLLLWGGGHNAYWGNEIWCYDIAARRWSLATQPTDLPEVRGWPPKTNAWGEWADGAPSVYHTYNGIQYDPVTRRLVVFRGLGEKRASHMYSFASGEWLRGASTQVGPYLASAYDARRKSFVVYSQQPRKMFRYDAATGKVKALRSITGNIDAVMAIDPNNDIAVVLDWRNARRRVISIKHLASDKNHGEPKQTGDVPETRVGAGSLEWVPSRQQFAWWSSLKPDLLYWLEPPDKLKDGGLQGNWRTTPWRWSLEHMGGQAPERSKRFEYGRFRWAPAIGAFVVVTDVQAPVYAYVPRLPAVPGLP